MAKDIGKLAELGELKVMTEIDRLVREIAGGENTFFKGENRAELKETELFLRTKVNEYLTKTRHYAKEYGLDFSEEGEIVFLEVERRRYKPGDFGL